MSEYAVTMARSAEKELERLPREIIPRVIQRIDDLSENPRPPDVRKLRDRDDLWRIRVGEYRVLYSIDDNARSVHILAVRHRRDAYR